MKSYKTMNLLIYSIVILTILATTVGIFSKEGPGEYEHLSIRGEIVTIYGKGLYKHMSADIAIQGIAQDVVTLIIALPILIGSFCFTKKGSLKGKVILTGTLFYFFLTYLFYLTMAMFNSMFLAYVLLLSASFFALLSSIFSLHSENLNESFTRNLPVKRLGGFLIFNAIAIGSLWMQVVVPPLFESTYPLDLDHYTTLIVQGLDLALFIPISFISGLYLLKQRPIGYMLGPIYYIFLSLQMTALTGKIVGMAIVGVNVIPVIFIIPLMNIVTIIGSLTILKHIKKV